MIRDRSVSLSDRQRIMVEQFDKRSVTNGEVFLKASSWQINIDFSQLMSDRLRSENDMLIKPPEFDCCSHIPNKIT